MRKIGFTIRLFAIIMGLLLIMQVPTFAATGKSTATNVRVRETASTDAQVIDLLAVNDVVEILSKEGDWYKVSFKGKTGYVSQSFISTEDEVDENSNQNIENSEQLETAQNDIENVSNTEETSGENVSNNEEQKSNQDSEVSVNQENNSNAAESQTTSNVTTTVYKMAETVSLNILPVVTSELIGEVEKDEEVALISSAGLWVYIRTDKISGWARVDKLSSEEVVIENNATGDDTSNENQKSTEPETTSENNVNEPETNYTAKTMYSKASALNVRSQANTTSDVIDSIGMNAQVIVVGEENDWYKVEVNGKKGYIRQDLLSNEKTEVTSRSNEIDRTTARNEEVTSNGENAPAVATQDTTAASTTPVVAQETQTSSSSGVSGEDIAAYAKKFVGCSYVYGAAGPNSFDCSGLTMYVYKHFGYSLSHSSKVQATQGVAVTDALQPGDILVFSNDGKTVGHVGIYIGNDQFVHASDSSTGVIISRLSDKWNKSKYWGARRIL